MKLRPKLFAATIVILVVAGGLVGSAGASSAATAVRLPALTLDPNQPAPPQVQHQARTAPASSALRFSTNWSGYAATSLSTFRSASTRYVQPAVKCNVSGALTVFWVGLDGWTDGTVEQDGTGALCNGSAPVYFTWWEMFPANTIQPTMLISPGDEIRDSVHYSDGYYTLTVKDLTAHTVSTKVETCASGLTCSRSSAEWIVERPTLRDRTFAKLADWGTMSLADDRAATSSGEPRPVSGFTAVGIDMVNRAATRLLATVGSLNTEGNAFLDTWDAAG